MNELEQAYISGFTTKAPGVKHASATDAAYIGGAVALMDAKGISKEAQWALLSKLMSKAIPAVRGASKTVAKGFGGQNMKLVGNHFRSGFSNSIDDFMRAIKGKPLTGNGNGMNYRGLLSHKTNAGRLGYLTPTIGAGAGALGLAAGAARGSELYG